MREEVVGKTSRRCGCEAGGSHNRCLLGPGILFTMQLLEVTRSQKLIEKPGVKIGGVESLHTDQGPEQSQGRGDPPHLEF